jgi:hypothetical protein
MLSDGVCRDRSSRDGSKILHDEGDAAKLATLVVIPLTLGA